MEKKRQAAAEIFAKQYDSSEPEVLESLDEPVKAASAKRIRASFGKDSAPPPQTFPPSGRPKTSEELQIEKEPIKARETGIGMWKRVIVPPNAYVVHTRIGQTEPLTLGLGVSFRYNPYTDAYLVVPSAMQTIGVVANCITKEKQGINVLAYVQWQIDDFPVAYRKLDFSDNRDPLGIVNAQLSEQAEAGIKDKISTMSVEEVLTDKAPIIEELTTRLKVVAEGRKGEETEGGLGIKIITVQIREALVSSQKLWTNLQAPFRHRQAELARTSELTMQSTIRQKELETRQANETREAETMVEIERIKQGKETEAADLRVSEELNRFTKEQEALHQQIQLKEQTTKVEQESQQRLQQQTADMEQERELGKLRREQGRTLEQTGLDAEANKHQKTLQTEEGLHAVAEETRLEEIKIQAAQQRLERETELNKLEAASKALLQEKEDDLQIQIQEVVLRRQRRERIVQLELEEKTNQVRLALQARELELTRTHQEIRNLVNDRDLLKQFFEKLPDIAAQMPEIDELKILQTGGNDASLDTFAAFVAKMLSLAESFGISLKTEGKEQAESGTEVF